MERKSEIERDAKRPSEGEKLIGKGGMVGGIVS